MTFEQTDSAEMRVTAPNGSVWFWIPSTGILRQSGSPLSAGVYCRTQRDATVHILAHAPRRQTKAVIPRWAR